MKKIILVGYMGSGKSKIGKLLAESISLPFYDLDFWIEKEEQKTIVQLFSEKGELYFRKKEHEVLMQQLEREDSFVLSLGGGTPCYANNHLLLQKEEVISIYLKASIPTLVERLQKEKEARPLIKNLPEEEMQEFIAKHLFDRSYFYHQCKHVVSVDAQTPSQIVATILALL